MSFFAKTWNASFLVYLEMFPFTSLCFTNFSAPNAVNISQSAPKPINRRFNWVINFLKRKYPTVETVTTSTLSDWLNNETGMTDKPGKLVLLVSWHFNLFNEAIPKKIAQLHFKELHMKIMRSLPTVFKFSDVVLHRFVGISPKYDCFGTNKWFF